jgi:hypothetical protein
MNPVTLIIALLFAVCCCCCSASISLGGFWKCTAGSFDPYDFDLNTCTEIPDVTNVHVRYVQIQQTTKKAIKVAEVVVFDGNKPISQDKVVKASSKLEGFSLQNLTSGGQPSDGLAGTTDATDAEYIQIDLGQETKVSLIYIVNAPDTPEGLKGCEIVLFDKDKKEVKKSKVCEVDGQAIVWTTSGDALQSTALRDAEKNISVKGRYVKLMHTDEKVVINLALVRVLDDEGLDYANGKTTKANSEHPAGPMANLTDKKKNNFAHTSGPNTEKDWMEIDLGSMRKIYSIEITNRADCCKDRAKGIQVSVLDEEKDIVSRTPLISEVKDQYTYTFVNGSGEWV